MTDLRKLLWLYLILLIFEGALRKWIIPALDAPLLLVRDPLVIWIYIQAARQGLRFSNGFFVANIVLAIITAALGLMFGYGGPLTPAITVYGLRTDFLQIPLIFLIPQILDRDDVLAMGKFMLYIAILMAPLTVLQFRSPPDSFWNKGTMATQYGTVRTSGTFSYGTGLNSFYALSTVFLLYGYLNTRTYKIWLLVLVTFATLLATFISGSRGGLVEIGMVVAAAIVCVITRGKGGAGLLVAAAIIAIAVSLLSSTSSSSKAPSSSASALRTPAAKRRARRDLLRVMSERFLGHSRKWTKCHSSATASALGPTWRLGMFQGLIPMVWPEAEWERLFFECGPIFGLLLCIFRTALTAHIGMRAFEAYRRDNFLPAILFASGAVLLFNGQWGVPTTLGFAIFTGGLVLAACNEPEELEDEDGEHDPDHEDDHEHDVEHDDADGESDHSHEADRIS